MVIKYLFDAVKALHVMVSHLYDITNLLYAAVEWPLMWSVLYIIWSFHYMV